MGDMADWCLDMALMYDNHLDFISRRKMEQHIWTARDGQEIHVTKMTTQHLINTILMIEEGRSNHDEAWIQILQAELDSRL